MSALLQPARGHENVEAVEHVGPGHNGVHKGPVHEDGADGGGIEIAGIETA